MCTVVAVVAALLAVVVLELIGISLNAVQIQISATIFGIGGLVAGLVEVFKRKKRHHKAET